MLRLPERLLVTVMLRLRDTEYVGVRLGLGDTVSELADVDVDPLVRLGLRDILSELADVGVRGGVELTDAAVGLRDILSELADVDVRGGVELTDAAFRLGPGVPSAVWLDVGLGLVVRVGLRLREGDAVVELEGI
jgi:hypothetical protein